MWNSTFDRVGYNDPRDELRARATRAAEVGDAFVAVPTELVFASLTIRECNEKTIVSGDPFKKIMIEVKCERLVDPVTGKHEGMHVNGRTNWPHEASNRQ